MWKLQVKGLVQGVGYRPFVWQLARQYQLNGWVYNDGEGVSIFIKRPSSATSKDDQNHTDLLATFKQKLVAKAPPLAKVDSIEVCQLSLEETRNLNKAISFRIVESLQGEMNTVVLADSATCQACLDEIEDPANRRFGYAFTNCTHCGPRYSIIKSMPYDRKSTSMASFTMCPLCQSEYEDPANRRFHAQPNACVTCGPKLMFFTKKTEIGDWIEQSISQSEMIDVAVDVLKQGKILAIKGIGGVHLVCDATHSSACHTLRLRKNRPSKPFALMANSLSTISNYVLVSEQAKEWLVSAQAPVVLMPKIPAQTQEYPLSDSVAINQASLGFMLPSNPIHHLLLTAWQKVSGHGALVFTSANPSGLPQIYEDKIAQTHLQALADAYLSHNREIVRRLEDSVVKMLPEHSGSLILRLARGFSPLRLTLPPGFGLNESSIAAGADLKNSLALRKGRHLILSQYLGDLADMEVQDAYQSTWKDLENLYQVTPTKWLYDQHPGYYSTHSAQQLAQNLATLVSVQHHHAHFNSCLLDNQVPKTTPNIMGIILDGLGYGEDNSLWGCEFLYGDYQAVKRVAHLNPKPLLGGDKANLEPWRNLYAQLTSLAEWRDLMQNYPGLVVLQRLDKKPIDLLNQALSSQINCPLSSSAGRLFDSVAALCGICFDRISYEGQAAMELEALVTIDLIELQVHAGYELPLLSEEDDWQLNSSPLFQAMLEDLKQQVPIEIIATRFHIGFAKSLVSMALRLDEQYPFKTLLLSGGVCQNGWLIFLIERFLPDNIQLLKHQKIPANDQSIALGQLVAEA